MTKGLLAKSGVMLSRWRLAIKEAFFGSEVEISSKTYQHDMNLIQNGVQAQQQGGQQSQSQLQMQSQQQNNDTPTPQIIPGTVREYTITKLAGAQAQQQSNNQDIQMQTQGDGVVEMGMSRDAQDPLTGNKLYGLTIQRHESVMNQEHTSYSRLEDSSQKVATQYQRQQIINGGSVVGIDSYQVQMLSVEDGQSQQQMQEQSAAGNQQAQQQIQATVARKISGQEQRVRFNESIREVFGITIDEDADTDVRTMSREIFPSGWNEVHQYDKDATWTYVGTIGAGQSGYININQLIVGLMRLTTNQRNGIQSQIGMVIWNTDNNAVEVYDGNAWTALAWASP
jgi:hypothetical protein